MKSRFLKKYLLLLFILPFTLLTFAQNADILKTNPSEGEIRQLVEKQIKYIQDIYSAKVEVPQELINGKEYESYYTKSKSKPILFPDKKRTASIFTKTRRFNNLTLQYDTFLDEIVYTDITRTINFKFPQIALNKDIVYGFNLYFDDDSLIFRYLRKPECTKANLTEGFYEIAYSGKSNYFIRHTSSYYMREGMNEYKYTAENFFSLDGTFYRIKNKGSLLKLLSNKAIEIKKYLHTSQIRIRQADRNQFIGILRYYDSL